MGDDPALPTTPEAVDPAWLTAALRAGGVLPSSTVTGVTAEVVGEDRGFSGVVARLRLRYDAATPASAPASLIAKFPMATRRVATTFATLDGSPEALERRYRWAAREIRFYELVRGRRDFAAPRAFFAATDDATRAVVLLLEDLATARGGDVLAGCSPEEAALVLDAIAPIHAAWWGQPDAAAPAWLPRWAGDPPARQARYAAQLPTFLERFGSRLPPTAIELLDGLRHAYAAVLTELDQAPAALLHGDLHLDNVLFAGDRAVILDWPGVARGAGAVDAGFFLVGSLTPDDRRRFGEELLRRYHARLRELGVRDYPFSALRRDACLALAWQLAGTVGWLATADLSVAEGRERDLIEATIGDGRLVGALLDAFPPGAGPWT